MIAAAGMLPGAGQISDLGISLDVPYEMTEGLVEFTSLDVVSSFGDVVTQANGTLSGGLLDSLRKMGQDFVSLTNAIPAEFSSALSSIAPDGVFDGGFTGLISETASGIMGQGDVSIFGQIFNSAQGFVGQANQFINSNINVDAISSTFGEITGGMDNIVTGGFNQVTESFRQFGEDLASLGNLIDMNNLPNLGVPSALVKQVASVAGLVPGVESALREVGLSTIDIAQIAAGTPTAITATADKLLYQGLTKVTGVDLQQVKNVLGVTTGGINTMADLLDPKKILPNSYTTLTMPTPNGLKGIYATANAVNTNLEKFLQDPNAPVYTGDDPIVRARLGLDRDQNIT